MTLLPHLAARLYGVPLAIHRPKLDVILAVLGPRIGLAGLAAPSGFTPLTRPAATQTTKVAVIPIHGTLVRRTVGLEAESGLTSYAGLTAQLDAALASPDVAAILLDVDSPGGESGGVFDLADRIRAASSIKPVWAVANDMAFSAAYALASAASKVFVSRTGGVGSIGVIAMHVDQSEKDAQDGVRYTAVFAGDRKNDLNPHEPISSEAHAFLKGEVNRVYGLFVETVARAEIMSLNGANTSSTHTIYVRKVEANATGGLVGGGVRHYADGGAVAPAFPRMSGGSVPGSGHHDTVPRTLDAGAFVIRKAAVQKYGGGALARLANGVARFATGGAVMLGSGKRPTGNSADGTPSTPKKNREAVEAMKMIDLGLQGMNEYTSWLQWNYGASVSLDMRSKTMDSYGKQAQQDRRALEDFISRKTLTGNERQNLERIKQTWRQAMAQPLLWGKDLERELIDYMEQNQGEFYRRGGMAKSDTVPAMLTPGEFVVNKDAVAHYGAGFFEAINNLSAPAQALASRVQTGIQGFATGGLVQPSGSRLARPVLATDAGPSRTVRVELSSGDRKVNASIDARDESRLLQLLDAARTRAV